MDLLSSIRKQGSRGGVNFSWDEVSTSQHRENYLGHSVMAPVGRWQKGRDLSWYAKGDDKNTVEGETAEERKARERKEEIRKIKEAEEDALARALGLPVADRNVSGSNAIEVGELNRVVKEVGVGEEGGDDTDGKGKGFGDFVGKVLGPGAKDSGFVMEQEGGLVGESAKKENAREGGERSRSRERRHRRHRHRSRSGERRRHRSRSGDRHLPSRHRSRSGDRDGYRRKREDRESRRPRSRDTDRRDRRHRSRSPDRRGRSGREERIGREGRLDRPRRSRSPARDPRRERDTDRR